MTRHGLCRIRRHAVPAHAHRQRGFSAVLFMVMMVMMAGLLAFGASFTSGQSQALAQEMAGARAAQAAQAGLEWGRFQLTQAAAACAPVTQLTVPLSSGNLRVTLLCTELAYVETGTVPAPRVSQLTATACNVPGLTGCPNAAPPSNYAAWQVLGWVER